jgi:predicted DNA-binding transcriptional regulator AlpA
MPTTPIDQTTVHEPARARAGRTIPIADRLPTMPGADERYLPVRLVLDRYGITMSTLERWMADPDMSLPRPVYFSRYRYFLLSELVAWERERIRARAA